MEKLARDMPIADTVQSDTFYKYLVLTLGLCFFVPACDNTDENVGDESTTEAQASLRPNRRIVTLYSNTTDLTLKSYVRQTGTQYLLDFSATCSAGANCEFIVERSSVADVVGMKLGDYRTLLSIQNNGFDGCSIGYGDYGQGLATRANCYLEDVRGDVSASFTW